MAEGIIGSVGVSVVPDASDFWRRFVETTRPGAVRAGAELGTDVRRGMQGELDRGVDVRVKADTGSARAEVAAFGATAGDAGGSMGQLVAVAATLAPALIPVAAVAIPTLATLGLGAKKAGQELKTGLTDEFHTLQRVAGNALTPGVEKLVATLQQAQPELKQLVGVFGGAISDELTKLSDALANGGLTSFIAYAEKELPIVEDTFNHIVSAVIAVGKALTPVGNQLLQDIDNLSKMTVEAQKLADTVDKIHIPDLKIGPLDLGGGTLNDFYRKWLSPPGLISTGLNFVQSGIDKVFGGGSTSGNGKVAASARETADALNQEAQAFDNTAKGLAKYDSKIAAHISNRLASVQAENAFIVASRGVADAVKANGHTLDASTAAGQQNRDALISAASAALAFYNAQIQAGVGSARAAQTLAGDVKQLELTAIHAGLGKKQVDGLLASMHLLPSKITTVFDVDITPALTALQALPLVGPFAAIAAAAAAAQKLKIKTGTGGVIPGTPGVALPTPPTAPPSQAGLQSALASFLQSVTGGTQNPITAAFQQLLSSIRSSGKKIPEAFVDQLRAETGHLREVAKQRDQVANQLERTQQRLNNLRQQRASEIASIRSAVTGSFDITTAGQNSFGEPVTLFDIRGGLQQALANAKRFEHVIKKLAREGLNKQLLSQLAEAGPQALPQAQALLSATPKQLAQINSEYRQLGSVGKDLGKFVGNDMYNAGIQAAQGLVKGLRSKEHELAQTMRHLAKVMIAELRNELDMHSPSRKLFGEGALAFEGYRLGVASKANDIAATAGLIAGKSIPNRPAYKFDGMARAGGGTLVAGDFINHQHIPMAVAEPLSRSANATMRAARNALGAR